MREFQLLHSGRPRIGLFPGLGCIAAMALLWALGSQRSAEALSMERLEVTELSSAADVIVIGRVKDKSTKFEDRLVQTTYTITANQYLRGSLGSTFTITQVGGSISTPLPLTQRVDGLAEMFPEERVLLFLENINQSSQMQALRQQLEEEAKKAAAAKPANSPAIPTRPLSYDSPLMTTPVIVGGWQGRFSIYQDEDGTDRAVQVPYLSEGLPMTENRLKMLRVVAARRAKTSSSAAAEQPTDPKAVEQFMAPAALRPDARALSDLKETIRRQLNAEKSR
jgi:hypothetical protein